MPTSPARRVPTAAPNRAESMRDLSRPLPAALSWSVLVGFVAAFAIAFVALSLPWWMPALYVVMSIIAFAAYGLDKSAARRGAQRTSEQALLTMGIACGWPGALIAQQVFRHKTRKRSFRRAFWTTVVLNILALGALVALATLRGWDLSLGL
ncbi:DUF1294 domain-containing protein [Microbacterium sp. Root166]|uniref:DUF1294 domain-containing protein n=1 Tax=Microbacterium sp. Root166 TaxID=1736478 RepID=UPI000AA23D37|nr:DUF1294 domain-containing protein [Microbacterium sp. Root166]